MIFDLNLISSEKNEFYNLFLTRRRRVINILKKRKREKRKKETLFYEYENDVPADLFYELSYLELISVCEDILERFVDQTIVKEIGIKNTELFSLLFEDNMHFDLSLKMIPQNGIVQTILNELIRNLNVVQEVHHQEENDLDQDLDHDLVTEEVVHIQTIEEVDPGVVEVTLEVEGNLRKVEVRRETNRNRENRDLIVKVVDQTPMTDILPKVFQKRNRIVNNRKIQVDPIKTTSLPLVDLKVTIGEIESIKAFYRWHMLIQTLVESFLNWVSQIQIHSSIVPKFNYWLSSSNIQQFSLWYEYLPILEINTKYVWENQELYKCVHTDRAKNQTYPVKFTLVEDNPNATTRAFYNDKNNWKPEIYKEVFEVKIQPIVKHKLIGWLEAVGCSPEDVQFQGQSKSTWVHPRYIDYNDNIVALKFGDIVCAIAWQCINTPRILSNQAKFIWLKLEWALYIYQKTRKSLHSSCSIVLPDLPEFEKIVADSVARFPNGCGAKESVCAPNPSYAYEYELDDLRKDHQYTYNAATGNSKYVDGAAYNHRWQYCDILRSDNNSVSPYRVDNKCFKPTDSQVRKRDYLAEEHGWYKEKPAFKGELYCFNRMGHPFVLPSEPLIHNCGRKCPRNCRKQNAPLYMNIPIWAMAFYAAEMTEKYSLSPEQSAKLFREFKIDFMKKIMHIAFFNADDTVDMNKSVIKSIPKHTPLSEVFHQESIEDQNSADSIPVPEKRDPIVVPEPSGHQTEDYRELVEVNARLLTRVEELEKDKDRAKRNEARLLKLESDAKKQKAQTEQDLKANREYTDACKKDSDKQLALGANALLTSINNVHSDVKLIEQQQENDRNINAFRHTMALNPLAGKKALQTDEDVKLIGIVPSSSLPSLAQTIKANDIAIKANRETRKTGILSSNNDNFKKSVGPELASAVQPAQVSGFAPSAKADTIISSHKDLANTITENDSAYSNIQNMFGEIKQLLAANGRISTLSAPMEVEPIPIIELPKSPKPSSAPVGSSTPVHKEMEIIDNILDFNFEHHNIPVQSYRDQKSATDNDTDSMMSEVNETATNTSIIGRKRVNENAIASVEDSFVKKLRMTNQKEPNLDKTPNSDDSTGTVLNATNSEKFSNRFGLVQ